MITSSEKKLYKVLRKVGIQRKHIKNARNIDDLYLDEFDFRLLVFYFETEFNVHLHKNDINSLTTIPAFHQFLEN